MRQLVLLFFILYACSGSTIDQPRRVAIGSSTSRSNNRSLFKSVSSKRNKSANMVDLDNLDSVMAPTHDMLVEDENMLVKKEHVEKIDDQEAPSDSLYMSSFEYLDQDQEDKETESYVIDDGGHEKNKTLDQTSLMIMRVVSLKNNLLKAQHVITDFNEQLNQTGYKSLIIGAFSFTLVGCVAALVAFSCCRGKIRAGAKKSFNGQQNKPPSMVKLTTLGPDTTSILLNETHSNKSSPNDSPTLRVKSAALTSNITQIQVISSSSANKSKNDNGHSKSVKKINEQNSSTSPSSSPQPYKTFQINCSSCSLRRFPKLGSNKDKVEVVDESAVDKSAAAKSTKQFLISFHPFTFKVPKSSVFLTNNKKGGESSMNKRCCLSVSVAPSDKQSGAKNKNKQNGKKSCAVVASTSAAAAARVANDHSDQTDEDDSYTRRPRQTSPELKLTKQQIATNSIDKNASNQTITSHQQQHSVVNSSQLSRKSIESVEPIENKDLIINLNVNKINSKLTHNSDRVSVENEIKERRVSHGSLQGPRSQLEVRDEGQLSRSSSTSTLKDETELVLVDNPTHTNKNGSSSSSTRNSLQVSIQSSSKTGHAPNQITLRRNSVTSQHSKTSSKSASSSSSHSCSFSSSSSSSASSCSSNRSKQSRQSVTSKQTQPPPPVPPQMNEFQPQATRGAAYDEINEFNMRINRLKFIDDSASSTALTSPAESLQHIYYASTHFPSCTRDLKSSNVNRSATSTPPQRFVPQHQHQRLIGGSRQSQSRTSMSSVNSVASGRLNQQSHDMTASSASEEPSSKVLQHRLSGNGSMLQRQTAINSVTSSNNSCSSDEDDNATLSSNDDQVTNTEAEEFDAKIENGSGVRVNESDDQEIQNIIGKKIAEQQQQRTRFIQPKGASSILNTQSTTEHDSSGSEYYSVYYNQNSSNLFNKAKRINKLRPSNVTTTTTSGTMMNGRASDECSSCSDFQPNHNRRKQHPNKTNKFTQCKYCKLASEIDSYSKIKSISSTGSNKNYYYHMVMGDSTTTTSDDGESSSVCSPTNNKLARLKNQFYQNTPENIKYVKRVPSNVGVKDSNGIGKMSYLYGYSSINRCGEDRVYAYDNFDCINECVEETESTNSHPANLIVADHENMVRILMETIHHSHSGFNKNGLFKKHDGSRIEQKLSNGEQKISDGDNCSLCSSSSEIENQLDSRLEDEASFKETVIVEDDDDLVQEEETIDDNELENELDKKLEQLDNQVDEYDDGHEEEEDKCCFSSILVEDGFIRMSSPSEENQSGKQEATIAEQIQTQESHISFPDLGMSPVCEEPIRPLDQNQTGDNKDYDGIIANNDLASLSDEEDIIVEGDDEENLDDSVDVIQQEATYAELTNGNILSVVDHKPAEIRPIMKKNSLIEQHSIVTKTSRQQQQHIMSSSAYYTSNSSTVCMMMTSSNSFTNGSGSNRVDVYANEGGQDGSPVLARLSHASKLTTSNSCTPTMSSSGVCGGGGGGLNQKPKVRFNLDINYEKEREWNRVNKMIGDASKTSIEWTQEVEV